MRHALMYVGGFERNFPNLASSTASFTGTDGKEHSYQAWPASANGVRVGYMEKHGKKFVAVRVADGTSDVILKNELVLVPGEHFGFGARLSGEPTLVEDDNAILKLVEDAAKKNADHKDVSDGLLNIRARLKADMAARMAASKAKGKGKEGGG
jgi:hypothetical protein